MILALFGKFWIVGPMTLALLPLALIINSKMFRTGKVMFDGEGLRVRRNVGGFFIYLLLYNLILQPACVYGYFLELLRREKTWGTK